MPLLLIFALLLFVAVLISCRARQSVLSTAAMFLVAGLLLGKFTVVKAPPRSILYAMAEIALYAVLFSDGMKTGGLRMLRSRWRPVVRVLAIGMPLTILLIAGAARGLLGISWKSCAALGAALSPTDPVFVAAIFSVEAVSTRVKETLSIESGFNDGLALPAIVLLLPHLFASQAGSAKVLLELAEGVGLGIAIPWLTIQMEELPVFGVGGVYERLYPFAIATILYAVCKLVNANLFLAAFSAGLTIATIRGQMHEAFEGFSEPVTELLKMAVILIFALRVGKLVLSEQSWQVYVLAFAAAFLLRIIAILVALLRSPVNRRDRLLLGWFGPKGFASIVYGIMLLQTGKGELYQDALVVALAVAMSIFGYSSTDVLMGQWLKRRSQNLGEQPQPG